MKRCARRTLKRRQMRESDCERAKVAVHAEGAGKGRVVIRYLSLEQLDGLLERMGVSAADEL